MDSLNRTTSGLSIPQINSPLCFQELQNNQGGQAKVAIYDKSDDYTSSFGFQWTQYAEVETREEFSKIRLEQLLGFPLEFLQNKNVLEVGCGSGRFTSILAGYARSVTALDYSKAVFANAATSFLPNIRYLKADLLKQSFFSDQFDVVICRGVIQHTADPRHAIKSLVEFTKENGLLIFDVYRRFSGFQSKYFWRKILPRVFTAESFPKFIRPFRPMLLKWHYFLIDLARKGKMARLVYRVILRTPFAMPMKQDFRIESKGDTERQYELMTLHFIDGCFSANDNPMNHLEIIETLAQVGQYPYSFDPIRNYFRIKKNSNTMPRGFTINPKNEVFLA